jgi:hypothetical protein
MGALKKNNTSKLRISTPKKKKVFIEALNKTHGVIAPALKTANIVRGTYLNWLANDPKFAQDVSDAGEAAIDFVTSKLYENIDKGKEISTIFYLKTRAGWIEPQHLDITSGGEKIDFSFGNKGDDNPIWLEIKEVDDEDDNSQL